MSVFAVVLTWNNFKDAKECIESLLQSTLPSIEVIVVDNASQNQLVEMLKKFFGNVPRVHFIENPENYGFAKGMNIGIQEALRRGAEYIILMNDDAVVDERCIEILCATAAKDHSIGIVGPRILYYNDPKRIWHGGGYFSLLKSGPRVPEKNRLESVCSLNEYDVDFLTGCVLLIKRKVFEIIGLLDEDYFLYSEDVDFCLRAKKHGFRLVYVPRAKAWHKISPDYRDRISPLVMYHMARSRILFLKKNFPVWYFPYALAVHCLVYTPFRFLQALKSEQTGKSMWAWVRGTIDGIWCLLPLASPR